MTQQLTPLVPPQTQTQPPPPAPRTRDPFFDNAKFLAILLVVVGHTIAGLRNTVPVAEALYTFIYAFHMPLFVVVTGYFSKGFGKAEGKTRKLIAGVAAPYVVFEIAYSLFEWHFNDKKILTISLLDPIYLTWFMLALFLWRLSTPFWQQVRWPLAVAVAVSLLGYTAPLSSHLDMHKVLGLAPFYVLGLCLRPEHFDLVRGPRSRLAGTLILIGGFLVAWWAKDRMNYRWLYWWDSHKDLGVDALTGTVMRLALMVAACVLLFAFLALVPRRHTWFTRLGSATIYTYLLHGFLIKFVQFQEWDHLAWLQNIWGMSGMIACALIVGTVLCTQPVIRLTRWAVEPKVDWLFRESRLPAGK
ncbi:acyltransferase family protein [Actinocorallia aurantiaca]|uniref:Acyltransferase family protein n=1 Tax=Actinocorallia aurantiaca TaxID=46204 RepID=A0ABN3UIM0_9ACTN